MFSLTLRYRQSQKEQKYDDDLRGFSHSVEHKNK